MEINNFVYGDVKRIFVNTDMGCSASCKYCYLPLLGIEHGKRSISAEQAIKLVEDLENYRHGKKGSVISVGCYSECMNEQNIAETITLVKHFMKRGNFVQLATKKKIEKFFFDEVIQCNHVKERLWIYISMPVITNSNRIEIGTDSPIQRIKNFELCKEYQINCALYIKPYLTGITIQDIAQYCELVRYYNIPAVVGRMLNTEHAGKEALVGENRLFEQKMSDIDIFRNELAKNTKVYSHSLDCVLGLGQRNG